VIVILLLPAFSATPKNADSIYLNGNILTMKGDRPNYAEAVAVKAGKVVFVGEKSKAMKLKGDKTQIKDLQGKVLLPGFIDPHSHFMFALNMVNQVNVGLLIVPFSCVFMQFPIVFFSLLVIRRVSVCKSHW
jgi:hypothetical protein